MLLTVWMMGAAWAAPVGDPVPHPETGVLHADVGLSMGYVRERDAECGSDKCFAKTERSGVDTELGIAFGRGLGVYGVFGRHSDVVTEVDYEGTINVFGGGFRLALPVHESRWLATTTDVRIGASQAKDAAQLDDPPSAEERIVSTSLLLVLGDPMGGGHVWFGPQCAWAWKHTILPSGEEGVAIAVPLLPRYPLSAVLGGALTSDGLAAPWRNAPRLRVSAEVRAGQEMGLRVASGLSF